MIITLAYFCLSFFSLDPELKLDKLDKFAFKYYLTYTIK